MSLKFLRFKNSFIRKLIYILSKHLDYFEQISSLPKNTYNAEINEQEQQLIFDRFLDKNFKNFPGTVCPYLLSILKVIYSNNSFNFLDYGARNIDNFSYLNTHMPNLNYFYKDLPQYNKVINNIKNKNKIKNLYVIDDSDLNHAHIDFVFMGSVLQYLENYKDILKSIFNSKPKYILISGQNCYENIISQKEFITYKQINVLPQINYGLFFHLESLKNFFKVNGWSLEAISETNFDNFRNFEKIDKNVGYIKNIDLLFKKTS